MKIVWRSLLALLVAAVVLAGVLVWRTLTFKPPVADYASVALKDAPPLDLDAAAKHLSEAVRIRTVSQQEGTAVDRAEWARLRAWVDATYPLTVAAMPRDLAGGDTMIHTWQGSDPALPSIILLAHQDVVPVADDTAGEWKHPPFDGVIADGAVWGRGSVDDKGSMIAIFEATEALLKAGFTPKRTIIIVNGHDEEAGQSGAVAAADMLKAKGVKAEFVLDEGLVTVADFPLLKGPAALIGIAEKGYANLKLTARASGGHSSMPPPHTAVETLARALTTITDNPDPMTLDGPGALTLRGVAPFANFVTRLAIANDWLLKPVLIGQIARTPAGAALLHTTMAPTMLAGSPKENVLAETAEAIINFRILPGQSADSLMQRMAGLVGQDGVDLQWIGETKEPSPVSSAQSEGFRLIAALASQGNTVPVTPGLVLASTDSSHFAGVAGDVYRFQPLVLSLDDLGMIHGTNEHLSLDNLKRMIEFYASLIATGAG